MTGRSGVLCAALVVATRLLAPGSAAAQPGGGGSAGRLEMTIGAGWSGGYSLDPRTATLKSNDAASSPFTLFRFEAERASSMFGDVRFGWHVAGPLAVEGRASYGRSAIRASTSGDPEALALRFTGEQISQYSFDGSLLWHIGRPAAGRRPRWYLLGGGGYLREMHEGRTLAENGATVHGGGGMQLMLSSAPGWFFRAVGVRFEGRATARRGAADFDDRRRIVPSAGVSLLLGF